MSEIHVENPRTSHVVANIDKASSSTNVQAQLACMIFVLSTILVKAFQLLSKARNESGLAAIQAGFKGADETAKAGLFQLGGGVVLAGAGITQGVAGCKNATEITEAVDLRESKIAYIKNDIKSRNLPENSVEDSDITIQVEALDKPVSPELNEIEEEIFYDAEEEIQSCKRTEPKNQSEEAQKAEKMNAQKQFSSKEEDRLLRQVDRDYDADIDLAKAKADKFQSASLIGQGLSNTIQILVEEEKAKGQKENIHQQVEQDNQNQQGNTADHIKKNIDTITAFDAFRSNSIKS